VDAASKLVASMLILFFVVSVVTGAATVLFLRQVLTSQTDQQLMGSISRIRGFGIPTAGRGGPVTRGSPQPSAPTARSPPRVRAGPRPGQRDGEAQRQRVLATLSAAGLGPNPATIQLGDLGSYRVMAQQGMISSPGSPSYPAVVVVGLPLAKQNATIVNTGSLSPAEYCWGSSSSASAGCGWSAGTSGRSTGSPRRRPRVAHLPLSEGKVDIGARVPVQDTDTRTEVGQVGAAFNEMLDHIDHALNQRQKSEERVRQFVADASHELRTPLASIRGYAELTRREQEPVPQGVTYAIGRVESEAIRMTALVDDLLLLARLDAGRPLDHETVDLTEMVVNAVSDAHAASPDHVWQLDLPDEPVEVQGDPARLHQIVANLLGNARTHTAPGTVVRTSIVPGDGQVRLAVRDNGPGVPEELQPDVFQRFARGDTSRNRAAGSTGLGLSIVAAVAQAHGGSVSLDSEPGDTTFTVLLPA
jgi:two-component system OmpR family sensor kinase